jgi:immune inhibitor A
MFRRLLPITLLLVLGLTAAAGRTQSSQARSAPALALRQLAMQPVPGRNLYQLADEFRLHPPRPIAHIVRTTSPNYPVGHQDSFLVLGEDKFRYFHVRATIRAETPHLYLYVANGLKVSQSAVTKEARHFERVTYPTDRAFFGSEWTPGVDGDPHITCLFANLRSGGVAGFFSAEDEYPPLVNPYSNAREMVYINTNTIPGGGDFAWTLAHEFQHMIHWHMHPRDNAWLNEGMSMLAQRVNGYPDSVLGEAESYLENPSTQLDTWSAGDNSAHYGGSFLFLAYLENRFGRGVIHDMVGDKKLSDFELVNAVLRAHHIKENADRVFADWLVASYLNDRSVAGGKYAYRYLPDRIPPPAPTTLPFSQQGTLPPYAAKYIDLGDLDGQKAFRLQFSAPTTVPLISAEGQTPFWWSNRGDLMDTSLTRAIDLTHVKRAHLHFQLWYEIEKDYDYGYVGVSTDGGQTWTTLQGTHTTRSNPSGYNYGNAYTGTSNGWLPETVDLSRYAGRHIVLRFEYITDDATNLQGMAISHITIPEIGFRDQLSGWQQHGFLPVRQNLLPSVWTVQLIETTDHGIEVKHLPLDSRNQGALTIDPAVSHLKHVTVIISSAAPKTTVRSPFTLSATPAG